jgi:hypothetical protein
MSGYSLLLKEEMARHAILLSYGLHPRDLERTCKKQSDICFPCKFQQIRISINKWLG